MICDDESLTFYLGTHRENWLETAPIDVALFVSHRILADRKTLPAAPAGRHYAVDSGAFTELTMHGQFKTTPEAYVEALARYDQEIGDMAWAAPQDWMCEPFMVERTGLSVREHQERTVANFIHLEALWPDYGRGDCPIMPVIQGWTVDDYLACVGLYEQAGVRLAEHYPVVGVGSVCRRQGTREAGEIFRTLALMDLPLHGFGVKAFGLRQFGRWLCSADSMAWSYRGRRTPTACGSDRHKNEANCATYALDWRRRLLRTLDNQPPRQPDLFEVGVVNADPAAVSARGAELARQALGLDQEAL